jgi:GNAT superfamily N-acetyltransferase
VVSVAHHENFTGERQAYLGELAVIEEAEGHGIGRALVDAAEQWARERGHTLLVLDTGAANTRARHFYANLGYQEESVRLVKPLGTTDQSQYD